MKLVTAVTMLVFGTALAAPAAQAADPASRQTATFKFTKQRPGVPSGLVFRVDYVHPDDPAAKPPAVRTVVEKLARGGRFDTSAPAACTASDVELTLLGPAACPPDSRVAAGDLTLDTGLPGPGRFVEVGVDFFNNTNEFIFLNQPGPLDVPRVVVRASVTADERMSAAPFLPGAPPDGTAVDTVAVRDRVVTRQAGGEIRSYVTTPPRCPRRGFWVNRTSFTYADGVTQTVRTRSRCERGDGG